MASLQPSSARNRLKRDHLAGGVLALLVQAGFLLLVLLSPSHSARPDSPARETLLFFPPLAVPAPSTIDARGPRRKRIAPSGTLPFPAASRHRLWRPHRTLRASGARYSAARRSIMPI